MMIICIMFRNGEKVHLKCTSFRMNFNGQKLTSVSFDGSYHTRLLHMDCSEVICIYRVMENGTYDHMWGDENDG